MWMKTVAKLGMILNTALFVYAIFKGENLVAFESLTYVIIGFFAVTDPGGILFGNGVHLNDTD